MKVTTVAGERMSMPKGYGLSYFVHDERAIVCHPIPINVIVGLAHAVYCYLKTGIAWELDHALYKHREKINKMKRAIWHTK